MVGNDPFKSADCFIRYIVAEVVRSRTSTDGLKTGALFGALFTATIDLSLYSMTTMYKSLLPIVIETVASAAIFAVVGMIIVLTWGKTRVA
jgi:hypothetical protein